MIPVWGGIECTINRVGDRYFDQVIRSGHAERISDLDAVASLGIRTLRYPALLEKHAATRGVYDFSWLAPRLERMRELGIEPIVTFLHHGSGPTYTHLLDPDLPAILADYARAFASAFPWVTHFTPINEPLTTARFSALYGVWYPHARDQRSFVRAVVTECAAIAAAMAAIREVVPGALLVQTEDIGETHAVPSLRRQADFENARRWISLDLLCGTLREQNAAMAAYLETQGIAAEEIDAFAARPCPPDIIGVNYYATSERFLDDRLAHYPPHLVGGNDEQRYVDIEAVRVIEEGIGGFAHVLELTWRRYQRPIAITEVHLGCTRDEQMRWLARAYEDATRLRERGADVRGVTVWSLLGAYDWNSLVTRDDGFYEPGPFAIADGKLVPTALARMVADLATKGDHDHPVVRGRGWWERHERLHATALPTGRARRERKRRPTGIGDRIVIATEDPQWADVFVRVARRRDLRVSLHVPGEGHIPPPAWLILRIETTGGPPRVRDPERVADDALDAAIDAGSGDVAIALDPIVQSVRAVD